MNKLYFVLLSILLIGTSIAQSYNIDEVEIEKPYYREYDNRMCFEYEVRALYMATNVSQDLDMQRRYFNSAEAFKRLDELGQNCGEVE